MAVTIGILRETSLGETRIAVVPEVVKKYHALDIALCIEAGAGEGSSLRDEDFLAAGAKVGAGETVIAAAQVLLCIQPPALETLARLASGTVLLGGLSPYASRERIEILRTRRIIAFASELIPRISRAQSMDTLSSQAAVAGYQAVLIAAGHCPKFFPMLTYAAGTIRPARVLVIGAGVAGLQAIATARRLGAIVEGYDVRPETREQIESLGAKFVDTGVSAAGSGGYARELTAEEKAQQAEKLGRAVANADVLITTAAIPGRRSPLIVSEAMIGGMKNGALVVDMAAEGGGNCAGTVAGKTVKMGGVTLIGPLNLPARMPVHASEMFARNLFNFISPWLGEGALNLDWDDEIVAGACLTREGELVHAGVRNVLGL
ncbi:MAG: NAD(P)(+) transhydrogenase (Re/Si-specific) subunit alpha [Betaproteobacteria bacterium HGW-Betaproteobacteria-11]|nr:MAG: NAD(P)(+) transhydrogenase (Re/Si-specific) subunit alpha [Betaproteobacteria bacterium HGW-Betaproteobacteria-11]